MSNVIISNNLSQEETLILGIETSCDETAAAIVANGRRIVSNVVSSQIDIHSLYGGVVPELASRHHVETILPVLDRSLALAGLSLSDLDAIAVTSGPGLIGALLVGVAAAKSLAFAIDKPLLAVHHLSGHIAANYLTDPELTPPFLSLIVSGAHAHIVYVEDYTKIKLLAQTKDDAAGEVFDKLARAVGLGYPGGPKIEKAARGGNTKAFPLPHPEIKDSLDFSFSGVKTAALNVLNQAEQKAASTKSKRCEILSDQDFAATVQETIVEILTDHLAQAQETTGAKIIALAGGVSANKRLRKSVQKLANRLDVKLVVPDIRLCTDNAAMIAAAGYYIWLEQKFSALDLNASALWQIDET
ncbi:MAG TPA: tRNA (adenosine(37)-N6)-threonylcarbamoyltransferase complex transferase subunit TsaD [Clostridiaceae bacterium]|nr:tRNA (adenosine(37)-N6)-threonylcarbamoyltransferase complex transferase subunit TsaD [Clostridiaceae bacterium]